MAMTKPIAFQAVTLLAGVVSLLSIPSLVGAEDMQGKNPVPLHGQYETQILPPDKMCQELKSEAKSDGGKQIEMLICQQRKDFIDRWNKERKEAIFWEKLHRLRGDR